MRLNRLFPLVGLLATAAIGTADYAGTPQRDYAGRTYTIIISAHYYGPVWYAGDGRVVYGQQPPSRIANINTPRRQAY